MEDKKPDLIILSETWEVKNLNNFHINQYTLFHNQSNRNQNDGVMIYINKSLHHNIEVLNYTDIKITKIKLQLNNMCIGVSVLYRSPSCDEAIFLNDLHEYFENNLTEKLEIYTGDINLDILSNNNLSNNE